METKVSALSKTHTNFSHFILTRNSYLKLLIVLFFSILIACEKEDDTPDDAEILQETTIEDEILQLVNQHRQSLDKTTLEMNSFMSDEARQHSKNMANGTTEFGHDGFEERVARIKAEMGGGSAAENVAYGYSDAQSVMDGWLNSDGHRKNIEGDYTLIGIGVAENEGGTKYYTQIFLKK